MKRDRILWVCIAAMFAAIMAASAPARAADYKVLVLIDASGSMVASAAGGTRFDAAKQEALNDLDLISGPLTGTDTLRVAVYTFSCINLPCAPGEEVLHRHTGASDADAFVTYLAATSALSNLNVETHVSGWTPLAGAMCSAVDKLVAVSATNRILSVSSDGEENATPGLPCGGDLYTGPLPYPGTSWQARTINYFSGKGVVPSINMFALPPFLRAPTAPDPEGILTPEARLRAATPSAITGLTPLEEFFTTLALATGGTLDTIYDDQPLPVPGDLNGDRCVDRTDTILVARQFGPLVLPADGRHDLNMDRTVDFTDYRIQLSRMSTACGPDPYTSRAPLVCKDGGQVVIDGQAIENAGTTIEARGSCEVVIRNSLIVSGKNAITVLGGAKITIDNSIIVGQSAVITQHGGGFLSAANTIFHGKANLKGTLQYIDRGGNVFE